MHEAVIVVQYLVCKKTPAGNVASYNNAGKHVKTIVAMSEADCIDKVKDFLKENEFKELK